MAINIKTDFNDLIDESWRNILFAPETHLIIAEIEKFILPDLNKLAPSYMDIFNAFTYFPIDQLKIIIIGQDPYPTPGDATGLSFSIPDGAKPPASLVNIMQALTVDNFTAKSGNMSVWANQGVLLLNSALTTRHKTMKAHHVWEPYTNYILKKIIEKMPDTILLLWGADAHKKACAKHVLKWSHPSPMADNRLSDENKFKNCHHFALANDILKSLNKEAIDWTLPEYIRPSHYPSIIKHGYIFDTPTIIAFTDGAASNNGGPNCKASYGAYFPAAPFYDPLGNINQNLGIEKPYLVSGKLSENATNNRAEFMGIIKALEATESFKNYNQLLIVSDSQYCINTLCDWAIKWKNKKIEKANMDLINIAFDLLKKINIKVVFLHMRGHNNDTIICAHYKMANEIVDRLAAHALAE